jgi:exodeoxyribonuclease-3
MKIISFNINGAKSMCGKLKNGEKKGHYSNNCLIQLVREETPDILCLQEIKTQDPINDLGSLALQHAGYTKKTETGHFKYMFYNIPITKKGYSGVALFTNVKPEWVSYNFELYTEEQIGPYHEYDFSKEGRLITAKFENCVVVTCYTPNSKPELERLEERVIWEKTLRNYMNYLEEELECPVILCGDLNVAPNEIDLHNPKNKHKSAGFTPEERTEFKNMIEEGFTDTFRHVHPEVIKYSYWSNFANSRARNAGWRIDHVIVSNSIKNKIIAADCLNEYYGSDHCPVSCTLDITL